MAKATVVVPAPIPAAIARRSNSDVAVQAGVIILGIMVIVVPRLVLWVWLFWAGGY